MTPTNEGERPLVFVDKVDYVDAEEDEWIAEVDVNGKGVSLKLDRTQVNILDL